MSSATTPEVHNVDPSGDLILKVGSALTSTEINQGQNDAAEHIAITCKRIRVSSEVLTLASPVFNAMLNGNFREGQLELNNDSPPTLDLPEDDADAMLLLCQVLHPHAEAEHRIRPSFIVDAATLIDKYGCYSACSDWLRAQFEKRGPSMRTDELGCFIRAAYELGDRYVFHMSTMEVVTSTTELDLNSAQAERLSESSPAHLVSMLREAQRSQLTLLSKRCQDVLGQLVRGKDPFEKYPSMIVRYRGGSMRLPAVCPGKAKRSASFVEALNAVGLWGCTPATRKRLSVADSLELLQNIAESIDTFDQRRKGAKCVSCKTGWRKTIERLVKTFKGDLHGLCLDCVKSVEEEDAPTLPAGKCSRHEVPNQISTSGAHSAVAETPS